MVFCKYNLESLLVFFVFVKCVFWFLFDMFLFVVVVIFGGLVVFYRMWLWFDKMLYGNVLILVFFFMLR